MSKPWLAAYGDTVPAEIDPDAYSSLKELLVEAVDTYGDKIALYGETASLSYRDWGELSRDFAAYLQTGLGVGKGDRIAVMAPNIISFPVAMFGILHAGAVQVNVNPFYTAEELRHQLNDAGVEIIVAVAGSVPTLAEVMNDTPVRSVIVVHRDDIGDGAISASLVEPAITDAVGFADTLRTGREMGFVPPVLSGDDPIFFQYTGGTTGPSKGAVLSNRNVVSNITQVIAMLESSFRPGEDVVVTVLPLYHIFGLTVNLIIFAKLGGENHLVAEPRDLDRITDIFRTYPVTATSGVNTLWASLVEHPGFAECDFSTLRFVAGGGAPLHEATAEKWHAVTGAHINQGYGMSEASPVVSTNPYAWKGYATHSGLPLPSTEVILLDDTNRPVPPGAHGEICVRGPQVMKGYWNRPEDTDQALTEDGFFRTGDIGTLDAEGFLSIVDRKKDMVLVSSFNVYPAEIETYVSKLEGIAECAAIGVPDEKSGEAVVLYVSVSTDAALSPDDIRAFCRKGLAAYKVPKEIRIQKTLPKSTVGKILRRKLRDSHVT